MTDDATADETDAGWFRGVDTTDSADGDGSAASEGRDASVAARTAVREGSAAAPADWPTRAVESGFAADETDYERRLRAATVSAARETVRERERADDRQLQHCIRALDDTRRTANELAERVAEWGGSLFDHDPNVSSPDAGIAYAEQLVDRKPAGPAEDHESAGPAEDHEPDGPTEDHEPDGPAAERVISLAQRVVDLVAEAESLESYVAEHAPAVAPNLSHLAGPTLAARLLSLAGGLESLAKQPSGTLQVLGAEDALFAHLRGDAPSPKHGVIYTHDYVRNTHPAERGSAARALAGKLTIAARIDHYSGDRRPALARELDDRIATIRSRHDGGDDGGGGGGGGSRSGGDSGGGGGGGGGGGSGSDGGTGGDSDD